MGESSFAKKSEDSGRAFLRSATIDRLFLRGGKSSDESPHSKRTRECALVPRQNLAMRISSRQFEFAIEVRCPSCRLNDHSQLCCSRQLYLGKQTPASVVPTR